MSKKWTYTNTDAARVGRMICTACQKQITDGDFRYRSTGQAYLPQHRVCSEFDKNWLAVDRKKALADEFEKRRKTAFNLFVEEFGLPWDLIEDYEE